MQKEKKNNVKKKERISDKKRKKEKERIKKGIMKDTEQKVKIQK